MKQIISKDGQIKCVTEIPYPPEIIKQMKAEGYKVKNVDNDKKE